MRGINKVILIGTLGKDPEVRYMPDGGAVCNVSLATNESWKDKNTGDQRQSTEWHHLIFYRRLAEIAGEYLRKASQIYVEGKLKTRKWQDKNGNDRYTTEIIVSEMQMLGGGNRNENGGTYRDSGQQSTRDTAPMEQSTMDDFDDDIPF